ncbi:STAS/SEC14 domain-containing protein [Tropicimonas sp. TH_r6]|uniref:STAS/SEC14 domain-containing protein n=1 Tax=Tropicimonas sp. TH_r6 TaxID=3082085 RepID=UPI00295409BF|nr:STAS/SEC14 domain-containing protein [Tropicimonas sp. TH_r6]MDV7144268.1 STAS/SEC14 domain-containing protein [Tropicimonas sp. TH_r6]
MITIETGMNGALIEATMSGKIVSADYKGALEPAIEAALSEHDSIRMLVVAGEDFEGYDLGAAWADTKLGLSHWRGFDRIAVVTDIGWMRTSVRLASPVLPCPVQVFPLAEVQQARLWLRESLGAIHIVDLGGPCVEVRLLGDIDPDAYRQAEGDLDARIRERDGFRLLLDLTEFTGWQGISALAAHFSLVREHASLPDRVAVIGNKAWQHMAQRFMGQFLKAESRFFDEADAAQAKEWLTSP